MTLIAVVGGWFITSMTSTTYIYLITMQIKIKTAKNVNCRC